MKELEDTLEGRVLEFYPTITNIGGEKYETVRDRIMSQGKRIKRGVQYKKTNDFEKARRGKNEEVGTYVSRLETPGRAKFGDEGINENKAIIKKFLDTVPNHVQSWCI